ncbi:MAG: Bestrophin, RFP-TM, chloride channel-domain-containing protein [Monoraphidium minutum]|nr:MAG: Bestrophin, RFP-TM, chloride channel-domain-containing protein [Monoraphidium minutum]
MLEPVSLVETSCTGGPAMAPVSTPAAAAPDAAATPAAPLERDSPRCSGSAGGSSAGAAGDQAPAAGAAAAAGKARPRSALARLSRARLPSIGASDFVKYIYDKDGHDRQENDIARRQPHCDAIDPSDLVFTFDRWNNHRNSLRYVKHLTHILTSRIFRNLRGPVLVVMLMAALVGVYETLIMVMLMAALVGVYETLIMEGILPRPFPHLAHSALDQGFNLTAFALSLLLVFRTNSSYDRWWEARKIWGGVVNRSRDIVRQSMVNFKHKDAHLKEALARWAMAFPKVMMVHLRPNMDVKAEVGHILTPLELELLCAAAHRPNFALQVMSEAIRAARPHTFMRARMDENLTFFHDALGGCERILRTPIPLSYTRHTSRFLLVWLMLLPFTLWPVYSWMSVLLSGLFAFLMFGVDEIGVQIEEPFGILPLEAITNTIEINIRELTSRNLEVAALVHACERRGKPAPAPAAAGGGGGGGAPPTGRAAPRSGGGERTVASRAASPGGGGGGGGEVEPDEAPPDDTNVCAEVSLSPRPRARPPAGGAPRRGAAASPRPHGNARRAPAALVSMASDDPLEVRAAARELQLTGGAFANAHGCCPAWGAPGGAGGGGGREGSLSALGGAQLSGGGGSALAGGAGGGGGGSGGGAGAVRRMTRSASRQDIEIASGGQPQPVALEAQRSGGGSARGWLHN